MKTGIWLLIISLSIILTKEFFDKKYTIEAFQVPKEFNDNGYNGRVLATKIFDKVQEIKRKGNTLKETNEFASSSNIESLDLQLAGLGFSVKSFTHQLRKSLGITNKVITGELTRLGDQLDLTLRVSGNEPHSAKKTIRNNDLEATLEALILEIAEKIVLTTDAYQLAVYYYYNAEEEVCFDLLHEIVRKKDEESKWGYLLLGNFYKDRKGDNEKAQENYEKALELDTKFHLAHHNLGNLFLNIKAYESAIEHFERATQINHEYSASFVGWGNALTRMEQHDLADEKFDKAFEIDPDNGYMFRLRGDILADQGNMDQAMEMYKRGLEVDPYYPDLYGNMTFNLIQNERFREGLHYAKEATEIFPEHSMGDGLSVYCYLGMGKMDSAKYHLDEVFKKDPGQGNSYAISVIYYAAIKDSEQLYENVDSMLSKGISMGMIFEIPFVKAYRDDEGFNKVLKKHDYKI
ncbi:MAG: tetratricopeptide repeat protein [Bacteroidota bacterium]